MATHLINALSAADPWVPGEPMRKALKQYDPIAVCKAMDERFEQLVAAAPQKDRKA
jgi:hypothetical protein